MRVATKMLFPVSQSHSTKILERHQFHTSATDKNIGLTKPLWMEEYESESCQRTIPEFSNRVLPRFWQARDGSPGIALKAARFPG
jgi:hypothetical protein